MNLRLVILSVLSVVALAISPWIGPEMPQESADFILARMGEVLEAAGCTYADVVMTTDYITTTDGYRETGAVRKKYFKEPYPASTGVIVAALLRPAEPSRTREIHDKLRQKSCRVRPEGHRPAAS